MLKDEVQYLSEGVKNVLQAFSQARLSHMPLI